MRPVRSARSYLGNQVSLCVRFALRGAIWVIKTDFGGSVAIQYLDASGNWQDYTGGSINLDALGEGEIRVRIINDTLYEGASGETFRVVATSNGIGSTDGVVTIRDDGTGNYYDPSGQLDISGIYVLDDDRPLSVSGATFNEGSSFIQWTVTGVAGQRVLFSADPSGSTADALVGPSGDITASDLQYFNGSTWVVFDPASNVVLDAFGSLLIRTKVRNDSLDETEANEGFVLRVKNTGGADASGISYLNDDGSGAFIDPSGALDVSGIYVLDDDRPLTISNPSVNENSSYVVFKVTGGAHQELFLTLPGQGTGNSASQWDGSSNRDPYSGDADYGPMLEIWNGTTWESYTANSLTKLDASGSLLVRTPIYDDFIFESGPNKGLLKKPDRLRRNWFQ